MKSLLSASIGSKLIRLYVNSNNNSFVSLNNRFLVNSLFIRCYRFSVEMSSADQQFNDPIEPFKPKRALVLVKFSRYEFEKIRNPDSSEEEFKRTVCFNRRLQ